MKKFNEKRKAVRKNFKSFDKFPLCEHQLKAKIHVASTKSNNPGRPYFCCNARLPDSLCGFFHWADQPYEEKDKRPKTSLKRVRSDEDTDDEGSDY